METSHINRFTPRDPNLPDQPAPFRIDDLKLNPLALLHQVAPKPISQAKENELFSKNPQLFEKRMVIIDGSNVARQ